MLIMFMLFIIVLGLESHLWYVSVMYRIFENKADIT